jgi:hypothetical protein
MVVAAADEAVFSVPWAEARTPAKLEDVVEV